MGKHQDSDDEAGDMCEGCFEGFKYFKPTKNKDGMDRCGKCAIGDKDVTKTWLHCKGCGVTSENMRSTMCYTCKRTEEKKRGPPNEKKPLFNSQIIDITSSDNDVEEQLVAKQHKSKNPHKLPDNRNDRKLRDMKGRYNRTDLPPKIKQEQAPSYKVLQDGRETSKGGGTSYTLEFKILAQSIDKKKNRTNDLAAPFRTGGLYSYLFTGQQTMPDILSILFEQFVLLKYNGWVLQNGNDYGRPILSEIRLRFVKEVEPLLETENLPLQEFFNRHYHAGIIPKDTKGRLRMDLLVDTTSWRDRLEREENEQSNVLTSSTLTTKRVKEEEDDDYEADIKPIVSTKKARSTAKPSLPPSTFDRKAWFSTEQVVVKTYKLFKPLVHPGGVVILDRGKVDQEVQLPPLAYDENLRGATRKVAKATSVDGRHFVLKRYYRVDESGHSPEDSEQEANLVEDIRRDALLQWICLQFKEALVKYGVTFGDIRYVQSWLAVREQPGVEKTRTYALEDDLDIQMPGSTLHKFINSDGAFAVEGTRSHAAKYDICWALAHFSIYITKGQLMWSDMQGFSTGANERLCLSFFDGMASSYRYKDGVQAVGNQDETAMARFQKLHKCGATCKAIGLDTHKVEALVARARTEVTFPDSSQEDTSSTPQG